MKAAYIENHRKLVFEILKTIALIYYDNKQKASILHVIIQLLPAFAIYYKIYGRRIGFFTEA